MSMLQNVGSQYFTADGVVNASGVPVRIYMMHVISTGGGGAIVSLRNGTTSGATAYVTQTGTTSAGVTFPLGAGGLAFPSGCFVDVDNNTASVTVSFERMDG